MILENSHWFNLFMKRSWHGNHFSIVALKRGAIGDWRILVTKVMLFSLIKAWGELLNKQPSDWWFETPWCPCGTTVINYPMWCVVIKYEIVRLLTSQHCPLLFSLLCISWSNTWEPFLTWIIPAWLINNIYYKVWQWTTYPFSKFNAVTVELWERVNNFIPHFTGYMITYPR